MDINKLLIGNNKLRALYNDPNTTKTDRKTGLEYIRRHKKREELEEQKARRLKIKLEKRRSRASNAGFVEKYTRYTRFEKSIWYMLTNLYGKSRVAPLEEWIASGIDERLDRSCMSLIRKDPKKDYTIDNVIIISNPNKTKPVVNIKPYIVLYDPLEAASGGALEGVSTPPEGGLLEEV